MTHTKDLEDHELEHAAAEMWMLEDDGGLTFARLREASRVEHARAVVERLVQRDLARVTGDEPMLTESGRRLGQDLVRRHRLAERLLTSVLDVRDECTIDRTACVMEHILSPAVTDSVCSFLGHPKLCPHGKTIPAGECCRSFAQSVEPLVQPLSQLGVGCSAKIVHIVPRDAQRMVRLSDLGLVPGVTIRLQQKRPATVIRLGETTLAVEGSIAKEIYVKEIVSGVDGVPVASQESEP